MKIEYSTNNSGGSWWLSDQDWLALEAAGWTVQWVGPNGGHREPYAKSLTEAAEYMGTHAVSAEKDFPVEDESDAEILAKRCFERATGQDADDEGCSCCGRPHNFYVKR